MITVPLEARTWHPVRRTDPLGRSPRALPQGRVRRTAAAVAAGVATTAGSHFLGTGAAPPITGLLLLIAVLAGSGWWLARDERGWERLAAAQLAAQLGGHALFGVTTADPALHAGHGSLGPEFVLFVHVAGAAVAGAWLRCGERRAVAAARRALAALRRLLAMVLRAWRGAGAAASPPLVDGPSRRVLAARLRHSIVHRGPPGVRC